MTGLDRRLHAVRDDLADARLKGRVDAPRFVEGRIMEVRAPSAPLRRGPQPGAPLDTEALRGERVRVFDEAQGWAWGQLETDSYVGYLPAETLGPPGPEPTHRVSALATFVYPEPGIRHPPLARLSFGSRLAVTREDETFAEIAPGGFVWRRHLAAAGVNEPDFAAIAERFLGVPYLWGGRTADGLDCSGLVQIALAAAGILAPRDSDLQESLGRPADLSSLRRGDLVFWPGHVGIMLDAARLLHANGHHMAVAAEPLDEAMRRIAATGAAVRAARRPG